MNGMCANIYVCMSLLKVTAQIYLLCSRPFDRHLCIYYFYAISFKFLFFPLSLLTCRDTKLNERLLINLKMLR